MTNGSSQGLFVIVAVVIFGIFVVISYLLFRDKLQTGLASIFTDSVTETKNNLGIDNRLNIKASREDSNYLYAQIREKDSKSNESDIWIQVKKVDSNNLEIYGSSTTDSNYSTGSSEMLGNLFLPDTINNIKITSIYGESGKGAFYNSLFDGTLRLPSGLISIGDSAFLNAKFSGTLSLPSNINKIGNQAFQKSNFINELNLPESIKNIGYDAFTNSKFTGELKLPSGIESIGYNAFFYSEFTGNLNIPVGYINIQQNTFFSSKFTGTLDLTNVKSVQSYAFRVAQFSKVISGMLKMSDGTVPYNSEGIHPKAIYLSNGAYYSK